MFATRSFIKRHDDLAKKCAESPHFPFPLYDMSYKYVGEVAFFLRLSIILKYKMYDFKGFFVFSSDEASFYRLNTFNST